MSDTVKTSDENQETGYTSDQRSAVEKQLLQIENVARAEEERAAAAESVATDDVAIATDADAAATAAMENAADDIDAVDSSPQYGSADAPVTSD